MKQLPFWGFIFSEQVSSLLCHQNIFVLSSFCYTCLIQLAVRWLFLSLIFSSQLKYLAFGTTYLHFLILILFA